MKQEREKFKIIKADVRINGNNAENKKNTKLYLVVSGKVQNLF